MSEHDETHDTLANLEMHRRATGAHPSASKLPWLLFALLAFGAVAFLFLAHLPMRKELKDLQQLWYDTRQANTTLDEQVGELERLRDELEQAKAQLAAEVERKDAALQEMQTTQAELENTLENQIKAGDVQIKTKDGQLVVNLADKIMFTSGDEELNDSGKEVLMQMGETLKSIEGKIIQIGGHTDTIPISEKLQEKYPTNWHLSSARAINVVRFLQEECGVPGSRLAVAGFSEYHPIAGNRTRAGRKKNRRIELLFLNAP